MAGDLTASQRLVLAALIAALVVLPCLLLWAALSVRSHTPPAPRPVVRVVNA